MKIECAAIAALVLAGCATTAPSVDVASMADAYLAEYGRANPLEARLWGIATSPVAILGDNSRGARAAWLEQERVWRSALDGVDVEVLSPQERAIYSNLVGRLESDLALRVCQRELWSLNHVAGWHLNLVNSIGVATDAASDTLSADMVRGWARQIAVYIDTEEDNLRLGLQEGYSAPRSVALQVANQMDLLAQSDGALGTLAEDFPEAAALAWREAFSAVVSPRLAAHAQFIRVVYAPVARVGRSVSSMPNGAACYAASIQLHTGAQLSVAELALFSTRLQQEAESRLIETGQRLWGVSDSTELRRRVSIAEEPTLTSERPVVSAATADVQRLLAASRAYFPPLPDSNVRVEVYPSEQRGGMVASYRPDFGARFDSIYFVNPESERMMSPRYLESVTSHEVAPGHHIQSLLGYQARGGDAGAPHQILTVGLNNAFVEGWAQYAEILAVEEGLLQHPETALHLWDGYGAAILIETAFNTGQASEEETALAILRRRGAPLDDLGPADPVLDWLAVMPGQILAYEFGADFIYGLRNRARDALGERFDYPTFHRLILEEGSVPLQRLEEKIDQWIRSADRRVNSAD